jgi:diguanylate cyclase (GGDEF)-like protein
MHIDGKTGVSRDDSPAPEAEGQGIEAGVHLIEQLQRLELAAQVGGLGVWDYDIALDRMTCDQRWYAIMGRDLSQPIVSVADFQSVIHPEDRVRATEVQSTARELLSERKNYGIEFRIVRPDGEIRWVRSSALIFDDRDGNPSRAVGYVIDVTDSWLAEQQLKQNNDLLRAENRLLMRQALVDPVTGISNRRALDQELERACTLARRDGLALSVAMIDIDYFKIYNDHYGHRQGDRALAAVAEAIASAAWRPYDTAARYGGEEFCLVLPESSNPRQVLERIMDNVRRLALPHAASPLGPVLTISCGCVAGISGEGLEPATLIEASDAQLYRAKQAGRNQICVLGE